MLQLGDKRLALDPRVVGPALMAAWLAGLVGLVFAAPILWLVREWGDNPYYEHGPLVPLISLGLAGVALHQLGPRTGRASRAGLAMLVVGLALRLVGAVVGSEFLGALALVLVLAGFGGWWLGRTGLRSLAFPVAYLLFAVPLPLIDDLGFYFQRLSTATTSALVKLGGIPASYQGAEISLPSASFIVGIQCSGLYSSVTLTALGLLFLRLLDLRSWRRRTLMVALIVPIALASNIVRLSWLLAIAHADGADVAMQSYHDLGGFVFWGLAMGLLFMTGKGLEWTQSRADS
jgi:exosortase